MARYGYMAHNDPAPPVARSTGERMAACGNGASWGENIAYGYPSAQSVVNGWLSSPGHRANIENPNWVSIGSGAAAGASGTAVLGARLRLRRLRRRRRLRRHPRRLRHLRRRILRHRLPLPVHRAPPPRAERWCSTGLSVQPRRPRAGETMTGTVAAFRNRDRMSRGTVSCYARIGGRRLEIVERRFKAGLATCTWRLPAASKGKLARAVVVVGRGSRRARAPFRSWIS